MMSVCFQSQAKSIAEQKRFPFATDNDSTNEELGENPVWELLYIIRKLPTKALCSFVISLFPFELQDPFIYIFWTLDP